MVGSSEYRYQGAFLCAAIDLVMTTPLTEMSMRRIRLASGEPNSFPSLVHVAGSGQPVPLFTGMAALEEVSVAVEALRQNGARDITLSHCTSLYPAPMESVHLYANMIRFATVILGNSSSGIIEAGLFDSPAINVDGRQKGHSCAANVHHCFEDADASGGPSAPRIAEVTKNAAERDKFPAKRNTDQGVQF